MISFLAQAGAISRASASPGRESQTAPTGLRRVPVRSITTCIERGREMRFELIDRKVFHILDSQAFVTPLVE